MRMFNPKLNGDSAPFELTGGGQFVLPRKSFVPAYVRAFAEGVLQQRAADAIESLRSCKVCPRDCEIDRFSNKIGVCKSGRLASVASAFPHFGEEDCLRGWNGFGHDLFWLVQFTLRILPEFRDQPVRRRRRSYSC
jgi:putative pyruvate formate lyase activating enzyme